MSNRCTRRAPLLLLIALLSGCATSTMNGIMESWRGAHIDQVVAQWGYPNAERNFRGKTLYVWNETGTTVLPSYTTTTATATRSGPGTATVTGNAFTIGGGPIATACERIVEIDQTGRVVSWQWGGNACCVMEVAGRCAAWRNPKHP